MEWQYRKVDIEACPQDRRHRLLNAFGTDGWELAVAMGNNTMPI